MAFNEERDLSGNRPSDYERWGVEAPVHAEHGVNTDDIAKHLIPMQATRWWMEGNILKAESNHGILAQPIPTDYICTGIDEKGLPILKKVV